MMTPLLLRRSIHPPLGGRPVPVAHVPTRRRTLPHLGSSLFVLPISHPHSFIASTNIASDEYRTTPTNTNNFRILLIEVELLIEVVLRANAWTNSTPRFSLKWVVETRDTPPANLLLHDATRRRISHAHDSTTIRMPSIPARGELTEGEGEADASGAGEEGREGRGRMQGVAWGWQWPISWWVIVIVWLLHNDTSLFGGFKIDVTGNQIRACSGAGAASSLGDFRPGL